MTKTVLIVDDSASVRQLVKTALAQAGYRSIEAVDGSDGLKKACSNAVDAIITDLNMPIMNGIEFIRKYRASPKSDGVPILFLSTESDQAVKQEAKRAGATGWVTKPFKMDVLVGALRKVTGA